MKKLFLLLSILCFTLSSFNTSAITVTLTSSSHHGYSVSCFGGRDGAITLTASGGTAPYTYSWTTGATTQNLSGQPAGYYAVTVTDATSATRSANITLTQPTQLSFLLTPSVYNGVNNISCFNCCNGNMNVSASGGVTAYSYAWSSGQTTANISNLCAGGYTLTVTDANGCTVTDYRNMTQPDKDAWNMTGNSGSNPSVNFTGTTDSVDFVLRTKNLERLRIKANGDLKIPGIAPSTGYTGVGIDSTGKLFTSALLTPWYINGNTGIIDTVNFIGTLNPADLVFKTTASLSFPGLQEHMRITKDGQVLIGATSGDQKLTVAHNDVNGGIALNRLSPSSGKNEIRFEQNDTSKWAIGNDLNGTGHQTFFIWDHVHNGTRFIINENGKVGINTTPPINSDIYMLYVGGGIKAHDVLVTATDPFPDYVFSSGYKSMSIYELEQFIKQNHHLPEIPSAKEIEKNEGFEVGDMQVKLLKKIEEQSLYIIEQQKQIDELKIQMKNLERRK